MLFLDSFNARFDSKDGHFCLWMLSGNGVYDWVNEQKDELHIDTIQLYLDCEQRVDVLTFVYYLHIWIHNGHYNLIRWRFKQIIHPSQL